MIPYLIIFVLCLVINQLSTNKKTFPVLLSCLLLSLFAGFRDVTVGADTDFYPHWYISELRNIKDFKDIIYLETILDKGFLFLYWVGSWFGNQYWIGLFLVELLITFFTFWGYHRLSKHYGNSIFFFSLAYLFLVYNYTLNAMRQECAISIAFLAFSFLIEKKWISCSFWAFIAFTFHSSTLITLLLPIILFISEIKNEKIRILLISFVLVAGIFGLMSFFTIIDIVGNLGLLNAEHIGAYSNEDKFEGAEHVAYVPLIFCIIIYYFIYQANMKGILDKKTLRIHFFVNTLYLFTLFLSLVSIYLYRTGLFFYLIDIYLFSVILSSKKINIPLKITAISYFLAYWLYNYVILNNSETIPYTSKILGFV